MKPKIRPSKRIMEREYKRAHDAAQHLQIAAHYLRREDFTHDEYVGLNITLDQYRIDMIDAALSELETASALITIARGRLLELKNGEL